MRNFVAVVTIFSLYILNNKIGWRKLNERQTKKERERLLIWLTFLQLPWCKTAGWEQDDGKSDCVRSKEEAVGFNLTVCSKLSNLLVAALHYHNCSNSLKEMVLLQHSCQCIHGAYPDSFTSRSRTLSADVFSRRFLSSNKNQWASFPSSLQWTPSIVVSAMSSATTIPGGLFSLIVANTSWPSRHPPHPDIPASAQTQMHNVRNEFLPRSQL